MRLPISALAIAGLAALATAESSADSDVVVLTKAVFDEFVAETPLALIEFYAPWCGHCNALAPEYELAAKELKEKDIKLAKVDCTVESELCSEVGVEGYPTLKIFRGNKDTVTPYAGARKADAIVSYMTKQSLPAVSILASEEAHKEFQTADKVVLVGYFAADDKTSSETFTKVAESLRDNYLFGAIHDADAAEVAGVDQPGIVLYKSFDEGKDTYEDEFDVEKIAAFAKVAATPLVGEVGPDTYADYIGAGIPLAYIFAETAEEREEFAKDLKAVAEKYKGKINFATIDAVSFGQHAGNLNLEVGKWPALAIQDTANNKKYPFSEQGSKKALSSKAIGKFAKDFIAGKIEPSIKSEPIPEKQEGPVTVVVAKNYQDVVIDNDKDVLVEFYAPWCGHCKTLEPKYAALAEHFKAYADKVVIAKVDATANDVPDEIQGFPTIKLFKSGSKDAPVDYSGARTIEDLAKFVRDNGSHKVDVVDAVLAESEEVKTDGMPQQAAAATDSVKEKVKEAVKKVAEVVADDDDEGADAHDEL